jgi:hypothetical protein
MTSAVLLNGVEDDGCSFKEQEIGVGGSRLPERRYVFFVIVREHKIKTRKYKNWEILGLL